MIERFEINGGRIVLYISNLDKTGRRFRFRLKAVSAGRVKMPAAKIYDYYKPDIKNIVQPVELIVTE